MKPECCKKCDRSTQDGRCLSNHENCQAWRSWFRKEWAGIRAAAERCKAKRAKEDPKK